LLKSGGRRCKKASMPSRAAAVQALASAIKAGMPQAQAEALATAHGIQLD